jgi:hypothetical protein
MKSLEWKWGLWIGGANLIWLLLSWLLGMHGNGVGMIQVMFAISFFLSLAGYVLAFRALLLAEPETSFVEGIRSGAIIAGVSAILAILGQVVYFTFLNPGWTDYLVGQTRLHYESMGVDGPQLDALLAQAQVAYGFKNYVIQSGLGALVLGMVFSAVIMGATRWRAKR